MNKRWLVAGLGVGATFCGLLSCAGRAPKTDQQEAQWLKTQSGRSIASQANADFFVNQPAIEGHDRYVHFLHLDGFHSKIFQTLLDAGQLPHFQFLLLRAKYSGQASTVDKSETMKVIQSYLTSKRETEVTGWWQFQRNELRFVNYDTNPVGLLDYALGLRFPMRPTILDFLSAKGENPVSGFSLERRGVPFQNYSRNYYEGIRGAFEHRNFDQAYATAGEFVRVFQEIALNNGATLPRFTNTLLAPADEMGHWRGTVAPPEASGAEACVDRKSGDSARNADILEVFYKMLENKAADPKTGPTLAGLEGKYFTKIKKGWFGDIQGVCFTVPQFSTFAKPTTHTDTSLGDETLERIDPNYVLGMMMVDMNLGRIIDGMRAIRFKADGSRYAAQNFQHGILAYLAGGKLENSYFERTLFLLMGDHGFADTKYGMAWRDPKNPNPFQYEGSIPLTFIEEMNKNLGLATPGPDAALARGVLIGIDDARQPLTITYPQKQGELRNDPKLGPAITAAEVKSQVFFNDLKDAVKTEVYKKYWFLTILRPLVIDSKLDSTLEPHRASAQSIFTQLYLRANPDYMRAEEAALQKTYNQNVRVLYGGAARNNAEIFIPASDNKSYWDWSRRPTLEEITSYRPGGEGKPRLVDTLLDRADLGRGTALMFLRKSNYSIKANGAMPATMDIVVRDNAGNSGVITVVKATLAPEPLFHYQVDATSPRDPLETKGLGDNGGTWGTYNDWNEWSIARDLYYHNVVGGMGDYLYSNNPSIGDISLMRSQGWNFGDNGGGHGGVHKEEKFTVMIASGPGIHPGVLRSKAHLSYTDGRIQTVTEGPSHPTVLDMMPTALEWLGYDPNKDVAAFAAGGFKPYLDKWIADQRGSLIANFSTVPNLRVALKDAGFPDLQIDRFAKNMNDLLGYMPTAAPAEYKTLGTDYRLDGNALDLSK